MDRMLRDQPSWPATEVDRIDQQLAIICEAVCGRFDGRFDRPFSIKRIYPCRYV